MSGSYDTLIIGGGMSALGAGIRLAYFGKRVCILERHYAIGGLNSFYRLRGREYDVGLHALTNFVPRGTRGKPLTKLLRQLRIAWDDFQLDPQVRSSIAFPDVTLYFTNDFAVFEQQVAEHFPSQIDAFRKLTDCINEYDAFDLDQIPRSARACVGELITDPLLVEMLFCPLCYYGSAVENDMDWYQFVIMFKSIFGEGFARPRRGVRRIIKILAQKYKSNGGELRTRSGVERLLVKNGRVRAVRLESGEEIVAENILSSAGIIETLRLCSDQQAAEHSPHVGKISFMESISVLDRLPADLGYRDTIVFFSRNDQFAYRVPDALIDPSSGVICSPNNFAYDDPLEVGIMRVTTQASFDRWAALPPDDYQRAKLDCYARSVAKAVEVVPDFRSHVIETDVFTPTTIKKFTGHDNGAVYGSPVKRLDGRTHLENLFICGTDQGFLGIIGAVLSGISIANKYLLH